MNNLNVRTSVSKIAAGVLFGTLAIAAVPAHAFPVIGVATQPRVSATGDQPELMLVSGGCGPYRHRGPYGGCRPNFVGGYGYRPYGYRPYGYRPFGYHRFGY